MSSSFIVLTDVPLSADDAQRAVDYLGFSGGEDPQEEIRVRAVVPADGARPLLAEVIDALGLLDLLSAWEALVEAVRHDRTPEQTARKAQDVLATVEAAFTAVGCTVQGSITGTDPLPAVREALSSGCECGAVVVFSDPQLVEETFAQDWAHAVEDQLGVAVLHLYPGSGRIGTA